MGNQHLRVKARAPYKCRKTNVCSLTHTLAQIDRFGVPHERKELNQTGADARCAYTAQHDPAGDKAPPFHTAQRRHADRGIYHPLGELDRHVSTELDRPLNEHGVGIRK